MIKVWKFPAGINIDNVRLLKGTDGISYLNPIQDNLGNWVVSEEEYNCEEFQYLKTQYSDIYSQMVQIDFEPKPEIPFI